MMSKKKRAKLKQEKLQSEAKTRKLLKRHGLDKPIKPREFSDYTPTLSSRGDEHRIKYPSLVTRSGAAHLRDDSFKKEVSAKYNIGQAYNKGNYVVLSTKEAHDPMTGKRR